MPQDNKKSINRVEIDTYGHAWAVGMANKHGMRLSEFCGVALSSLAVAWKIDTDELAKADEFDAAHMELAITHLKIQQRHRLRQMVREAAVIHTQYPDDVSADQLGRMCELAGLDLTEIMGVAQSSEFGSLIAYSRDGSKFGKCLQWLAHYITEESQDGGGVLASQIFAAGKSHGFEEQMIQRAKRRIKADPLSPTIQSRRVASGWVWDLLTQEEIST